MVRLALAESACAMSEDARVGMMMRYSVTGSATRSVGIFTPLIIGRGFLRHIYLQKYGFLINLYICYDLYRIILRKKMRFAFLTRYSHLKCGRITSSPSPHLKWEGIQPTAHRFMTVVACPAVTAGQIEPRARAIPKRRAVRSVARGQRACK